MTKNSLTLRKDIKIGAYIFLSNFLSNFFYPFFYPIFFYQMFEKYISKNWIKKSPNLDKKYWMKKMFKIWIKKIG